MRKIVVVACCTAFLASSGTSAANTPCPPKETGVYPWAINAAVPGDLWANVYLDIDQSGYPLRCYIGQNNISGEETRSDVCRSFVSGWRGKPQAMPNGSRVIRIKRLFILAGPRHDKLMEEAKKRYFGEHPDERPECWKD